MDGPSTLRDAGIQPFDIQSDSLPLKQSNSSSLLESAEVTSKTAIGKMFSCEAPYTAKAKEGSLESRNSEKIRDNVSLSRLFRRKNNHSLINCFVRTFNNVLPYIQAVELASAIDHMILAEMDAVTRVACLDLLQVKRARNTCKTLIVRDSKTPSIFSRLFDKINQHI